MTPRSTKTRVSKGKRGAEGVSEEERLRDYELTLVLNPEVAEEKIEATLGDIGQLITGLGGAISSVTRWGKRKLAYPVKHFSEGSYVLVQLKLKSVLSRDLEAKLHISEDVIRHLLIRTS